MYETNFLDNGKALKQIKNDFDQSSSIRYDMSAGDTGNSWCGTPGAGGARQGCCCCMAPSSHRSRSSRRYWSTRFGSPDKTERGGVETPKTRTRVASDAWHSCIKC